MPDALFYFLFFFFMITPLIWILLFFYSTKRQLMKFYWPGLIFYSLLAVYLLYELTGGTGFGAIGSLETLIPWASTLTIVCAAGLLVLGLGRKK